MDSTKEEVQAAYKDFPLVDHPASDFTTMNTHSLANQDDNSVDNPFLAFNNSDCFAENYPNNPFNGSLEMIFSFDNNNKVSRIIVYYPTAG